MFGVRYGHPWVGKQPFYSCLRTFACI